MEDSRLGLSVDTDTVQIERSNPVFYQRLRVLRWRYLFHGMVNIALIGLVVVVMKNPRANLQRLTLVRGDIVPGQLWLLPKILSAILSAVHSVTLLVDAVDSDGH